LKTEEVTYKSRLVDMKLAISDLQCQFIKNRFTSASTDILCLYKWKFLQSKKSEFTRYEMQGASGLTSSWSAKRYQWNQKS